MAPPPRIVFLHGFTQTHHHWHRGAFALLRSLGTDATLVLPDLPGHGLSAHDRRPIVDTARSLPAQCGPGVYVGYSMGGRVALVGACEGADEIKRLVVIGATPGIEDEHDRAQRRDADEQRARAIETNGVASFLDSWLELPMFATLRPDPDDRRHRLANTPAGLAASLRSAGTGSQPDLWPRLGSVDIPVLAIAGELDHKFSAVARRMAEALPNGTFASIGGAGHAAHLERPEAVGDVIARWLADQPGPSARPSASNPP